MGSVRRRNCESVLMHCQAVLCDDLARKKWPAEMAEMGHRPGVVLKQLRYYETDINIRSVTWITADCDCEIPQRAGSPRRLRSRSPSSQLFLRNGEWVWSFALSIPLCSPMFSVVK